MTGILFTQCLQNDFVQPLEKHEPLPNSLHVGYEEALRLMGERPLEGPVALLMDWAYSLPEEKLEIIHIRDWHDGSLGQQEHLEQFGNHCQQGSSGAEFVFKQSISNERNHYIINSTGLNDFIGTNCAEILEQYRGMAIPVGITGVWTEAKVMFLAYELKTRYPEFQVGLCSALTASSSRKMHFISLDQMRNILGLQIFSSIGSFTSFLTGSMATAVKRHHPRIDETRLTIHADYSLQEEDKQLLLYLFRDCMEIEAECLDGGYSGNVVMKTKSRDLLGHRQVPSVVKIGDRDLIGEERIAFERVQEVMGNSAPAIVDFAEIGSRGGIKYRYAAMLDGEVETFQKVYMEGRREEALHVLDTVFSEHLGRLYEAVISEKIDLLEYYDFNPKYAGGVRECIAGLVGGFDEGEDLMLPGGIVVTDVSDFYRTDLVSKREYTVTSHPVCYVHGDLNGRNIVLDGQKNVWIIDFFHTHRGHGLRDLIKLENDILYIMTPVKSEDEFLEALELSRLLIDISDLAVLPEKKGHFRFPQFEQAFDAVRTLRKYMARQAGTDRGPYQLHAGLLRYSVHTLSFDEANQWQRLWALYSSGLLVEKIREFIGGARKLRIAELLGDEKGRGGLGVTILPGRKDWKRSVEEDIGVIQEEGFSAVLSLITEQEYRHYGVSDLKNEMGKAGLTLYHLPVLDQKVPTVMQMKEALTWLNKKICLGEKCLVHCVGGLGRSGTAAACYLVEYKNMEPGEAIEKVREVRSPRAIESRKQEDFVYKYRDAVLKGS